MNRTRLFASAISLLKLSSRWARLSSIFSYNRNMQLYRNLLLGLLLGVAACSGDVAGGDRMNPGGAGGAAGMGGSVGGSGGDAGAGGIGGFGGINSMDDCGDGIRQSTEACDDGNRRGADGCAADCMRIEDGFRCPVSGVACVPIACGDSRIDPPEQCDD